MHGRTGYSLAWAISLVGVVACGTPDEGSRSEPLPRSEVRYLTYGGREGSVEEASHYIKTNGGNQAIAAWKAARCLSEDSVGVEYFNSVDLGLGRRLTFSKCPGTAAACVENFGKPSQSAIDGLHALNSGSTVAVCMDYSSLRPKGFETQFFVFSNDEVANGLGFDRQGLKFVPFACTACHGGRFLSTGPSGEAVNMVEGGQFLPLLKESLFFKDGVTTAEEAIVREMNEIVYDTSTAPGVHQLLDTSYPGSSPGAGVHVLGAVYQEDRVPESWADHPEFYQKLIRPHCLTCHAAQPALPFGSFAEVPMDRLHSLVCSTREMPNSLQGRIRLDADNFARKTLAGCPE